uniref:Secreted protein n=1 Tax=Globodera rostochiensis TaxID=31243 RepID=A0A914HGH3_GLORO
MSLSFCRRPVFFSPSWASPARSSSTIVHFCRTANASAPPRTAQILPKGSSRLSSISSLTLNRPETRPTGASRASSTRRSARAQRAVHPLSAATVAIARRIGHAHIHKCSERTGQPMDTDGSATNRTDGLYK